jgi:two-component system, cell cycle sensor histidine kinase and response regulator CckA
MADKIKREQRLSGDPETPETKTAAALKGAAIGRGEVEEALRENEKRYQALVESSGDTIFEVDPEGRFLFINPAGARQWGNTSQAVVGRSLADVFGPGAARTPREMVRTAVTTRKPLRMEHPLVMQGRPVFYSTVLVPVIGDDGRVRSVFGIGRDVTELKQAEEALRDSEEKYRLLIENANEAIVVVQDERFRFFNRKLLDITGYGAEELASAEATRFVHPEDQEKVLSTHRARVSGGEVPPVYAFRFIHKQGQIRWLEISAVGITWEDRPATLSFLNDITDRRKTEDALRQSEERYRELTNTLPQTVFETDERGKLTFVNSTGFETFGYSPEDFEKGLYALQMIVEEDRTRGAENIGKVLRGEKGAGKEYTALRKDGTTFTAIISSSAIFRGGGPVGLRGILTDISERRQAEQEKTALQDQLRQSQKMEAIGRLAGGVAHDFNNLLTVIRGYTEFSLLEIKDDDPLRENIREIEKATDRATNLTRQLLAFSRRQVMELRVVDLNAILMDLEKMLRRVIGEDIELVTVYGQPLGLVKADPGQIEQVVFNLAANARDAMPRGGKFILETADVELDQAYADAHVAIAQGPFVRLSVSDTGTGMTPNIRERVFEPFFTTKEKGKGTGLGLSTVYGIVKQSGGYVWVYSEPGRGTTFKIYLPRVDEALEAGGKGEEEDVLPRGDETVIFVEDEDEVRKLGARILRSQGYTVFEASHGAEALFIAGQLGKPIHLMITDVVMPGMSGADLARRLKALLPETNILYISGYTDQAIIQHGLLEKGSLFLQKPFTHRSLCRKVRSVLDAAQQKT